MKRFLGLMVLVLAIAVGCARSSSSTPSIGLQFPIECKLGQDCFVLLYPDRDPSASAIDYGCGRMTYDDHKGTDFALPHEQLMQRGVPVIAAASGTVLRVRDGMRDRRVRNDADEAAVKDSECGNGLIIDHGNGWETQYCHLRQNSIQVKPQETVRADQTLGFVGESGLASFPHVHLTLRYQGRVVDPSVGLTDQSGCQVRPKPLWVRDLPYQSTGLIRSGIAPKAPTLDDLWRGEFQSQTLSSQATSLVFWVQLYGLLKGDEERFEIRDPSGVKVATDVRVSDRPRRIAMGFIGKKFDPGPIPPGSWVCHYQLKRNGKSVISIHQTFQVSISASMML